MMNAHAALLWLCWQRARIPLVLVLSAVVGLVTILLVFLDVDEGNELAASNTIAVVTAIGVWMLGPLVASGLGKPKNSAQGVGFPLQFEFGLPIANRSLVLVPFTFIVFLLFASFSLLVWLLTTVFSVPPVDPLIHFMAMEYLIIVTAVGWSTNNGYEAALCWIGLIFMFYLGWLIPDFSFNGNNSEFVAGAWSSALPSALLALLTIALMLFGVSRQRSGENLFFSSGGGAHMSPDRMFIEVFRFYKSPCPTSSGAAALRWEQRQFRGLQVALGLGIAMGVLVSVVISLIEARNVWDGPIELDDVQGFAFIFYCSVFVAHLATSLGVRWVNGSARTSTFERTLPVSTLRLTLTRIGLGTSCLVIAAIAEVTTIALLGPLFLENYAAIRDSFLEQLTTLFGQGAFYVLLRIVLSVCLIYVVAVLWAVFISWFAIRSRLMAIAFAAICLYALLILVALVSLVEESDFVAAVAAVGHLHSWVLSIGIIVTAAMLLYRLVVVQVLNPAQALVLLMAGLGLATLQIADLQLFDAMDAEAALPVQMLAMATGLLPLMATVMALWTQFRIRHG
jgi:hypothetical protein